MTTQVVGAPPAPAAQSPEVAAAWAQYYAQQAAAAGAGAAAMPYIPAGPPMVSIPGVTIATDKDFTSPMLSVCSKAKVGKSRSVITSLVDWPTPGKHPLVIAVDDSGPLSCIDAGYYPHRVRLREEDYPGLSFDQAIMFALTRLHQNRQQLQQQFGSIVVDCGSTLADKLHTAAKKIPKNARNPNMQAPFFELGVWFRQVIGLVRDLDLPNVWLSWSTDGFVEPANKEEKKPAKSIPGGPDILGGKLRNYYSGQPAHNFYMEKRKVGVGGRDYDTGLVGDQDGFVRVMHSKPYDNIDAGGRLQRFLPAVCPAHVGWILSQITGLGPFAPQGGRR